MSNKIYVVPQTRTVHIPYCREIKEIRAPTDESIKLYEEIKEKAYNSILNTIELRDNSFNLNAILYKECLTMENVCKYIFSLNGKKIQGEVRSSELDFSSKEEIITNIITKAAETLAIELGKIVFKLQCKS